MRKRIGTRKSICFLIIGILMTSWLLTSQSAFASEKTGTLTVYYHGVTPQGVQAVLPGAGFSLYKVGEKVENEWKLQGDFEKAAVNLEDMSSSVQRKVAEQLYDFAVKEKLQGEIKTTESDGKAVFHNLEEGIYLCVPTSDVSYDNGLFHLAPFLVFVPEMDENGNSFYDVTVEPKNEWVENEAEPQKPILPEKDPANTSTDDVKTGDDTNIWLYVILLFVSVCMIIIRIYKKEKMCDEMDL